MTPSPPSSPRSRAPSPPPSLPDAPSHVEPSQECPICKDALAEDNDDEVAQVACPANHGAFPFYLVPLFPLPCLRPVLPISHPISPTPVFHHPCIASWTRTGASTCPLDRHPITYLVVLAHLGGPVLRRETVAPKRLDVRGALHLSEPDFEGAEDHEHEEDERVRDASCRRCGRADGDASMLLCDVCGELPSATDGGLSAKR
ncbi:hypothetical protein M427DRAFT_427345 [Gonapodya prolifera JEL478]|uniref:Uncharacterized protein n=1 Tax=Gonapodya prolifera (strain JEL478) TaxID=1344416 RepID=A0A139ASP3_GONPJ|nr:hypothetical protein M427DRAFT_427345 [Gonapodya prolifera JEL478]|eukprot:KXS19674.1 hypothetical protein M427DRAFT_427345 [Gonapodya prolifera JEL478]